MALWRNCEVGDLIFLEHEQGERFSRKHELSDKLFVFNFYATIMMGYLYKRYE
jgi:hypothetical protein